MTNIWSTVALAARRVPHAGSVRVRLLAGGPRLVPSRLHQDDRPAAVRQQHAGASDVERRITDKVRTELIGRGRYTIKSEQTGVDARVDRTRSSRSASRRRPSISNSRRRATAVTLVANIEFKDLKTDKVLWSNPSHGVQRAIRHHVTIDAGAATAIGRVPRAERQRAWNAWPRSSRGRGQCDPGVVLIPGSCAPMLTLSSER